MPELSRFGGMIICMFFRDDGQHHKPHVHVYYGEHEAEIAIDGELLAGSLPRKQMRIIVGWLAFHEEKYIRHGIWQCRASTLKRCRRWNEVTGYVYQGWYLLCGNFGRGHKGHGGEAVTGRDDAGHVLDGGRNACSIRRS